MSKQIEQVARVTILCIITFVWCCCCWCGYVYVGKGGKRIACLQDKLILSNNSVSWACWWLYPVKELRPFLVFLFSNSNLSFNIAGQRYCSVVGSSESSARIFRFRMTVLAAISSAISNRPFKLLAIQIAAESPVVYTLQNCRWNRRKHRQCKRPLHWTEERSGLNCYRNHELILWQNEQRNSNRNTS